MEKKPFESNVGKVENAVEQHFLLYPHRQRQILPLDLPLIYCLQTTEAQFEPGKICLCYKDLTPIPFLFSFPELGSFNSLPHDATI